MPPIYIINLPYKIDRKSDIESRLLSAKLVEQVGDVHWLRAISGDWCWPPNWWKSGNGAWGCLMSHLRLVQDATMDGLESYMVLEDDAVFQPRAKEMLERLMREVPDDWDQIYLGGQHLKEPTEVPSNPFILKCQNVNRTHGFILRRRAFAKFQQHIMHAPDYIAHPGWHIDHQLGVAHERADWNVYAPAWWICGQEEGSSNISGRVNPRMWWHPGKWAKHLPFTLVPQGVEHDLSARIAPHLHCGHNILAGSWQDRGLDESMGTAERLRDWMQMIAREALTMEKFPGIQHPALTLERLRALWPAGVFAASEAKFDEWAGYPWNSLFPHPLGESAPRVMHRVNAA